MGIELIEPLAIVKNKLSLGIDPLIRSCEFFASTS
jgi:hypothetical protein